MSGTLATVTSSCRLSNEAGRGLLTVRGQHFVTDAPPSIGGPNEAVNPVELLLSALVGCAVLLSERAAQEAGIALKGVQITAAGDFDPRGVCGEAFDPRFQVIRLRVAFDGLDDAQVSILVNAIKTRCPVYTTLSRAVPIELTFA